MWLPVIVSQPKSHFLCMLVVCKGQHFCQYQPPAAWSWLILWHSTGHGNCRHQFMAFQAFLVGTLEQFFGYTDLHKFSFGFRLEGLQEMVQECTTALLISFLLRCAYIIWISVSNIFWQGQDLAQTCKDLFFYFLAICSELELANF
jgi:hypothetical protein